MSNPEDLELVRPAENLEKESGGAQMIDPIERTLALYDDLVVIARCLETIEVTGGSMKLMDENGLIKARDETDAAWADVQHTRNRLDKMGVTP